VSTEVQLFRQTRVRRSIEDYHLEELKIAMTPSHPRRALPDISAECSILDVGCGAGQTLIACGVDGPRAWGVDLCIEALRLGKRLSEHTNFVLAAGEALPFPDNSFDFVISRIALPYMRVVDAVREMARVLRPGGGVWLTLHAAAYTKGRILRALRSLDARSLIFQLYVLCNGLLLHLLGRQIRFPLTRRCESFQTGGAMRRTLLAAGFQNIVIDRRHHFVVTAKKASLDTPPLPLMAGRRQ
jgi:ubiquinone/menaquinone biosynthesis C-methylase UbiE